MGIRKMGDVQKSIICILLYIYSERNSFRTACLPACSSGFRNSTMHSVYLDQSTLVKKGWDLISSTPPTPAPSLSIGLYWSNCRTRQKETFFNSVQVIISDACISTPSHHTTTPDSRQICATLSGDKSMLNILIYI